MLFDDFLNLISLLSTLILYPNRGITTYLLCSLTALFYLDYLVCHHIPPVLPSL